MTTNSNPNFDQLFGGRYIKADDMPEEEDLPLTIAGYAFEPVGPEKEMKLVLSFKESEKTLVLNTTNARTIANLYGKDFEEWAGRRIALYATEVDFAGKTVMAVRVRIRAPKKAAQQEAEY
jgi:hypothetical protein